MTALVKGHVVKERIRAADRRFPVAAAVACWEGGLAALTSAGVVKPFVVATGLKCVGLFMANADNRTGLASAISADVRRGVFLVANSATDPVALADIGASVYGEDDSTISKTGAPSSGAPTQSVVGTVYDIDPSGGVWVEIK